MRNTHLSLKLQLFKGRLFDAFKKENLKHKAKLEEVSDEELTTNLLNLSEQSTTISVLRL